MKQHQRRAMMCISSTREEDSSSSSPSCHFTTTHTKPHTLISRHSRRKIPDSDDFPAGILQTGIKPEPSQQKHTNTGPGPEFRLITASVQRRTQTKRHRAETEPRPDRRA
ncbi:hypothetical protein ILYODFUR_024232 [Ilyodon furcidens]|uniref:Uncharacterized protein n=1 Tax=Ilyodon furcidens TaxID=33524 RepID=A0ABV0TAW9_9TELE